MKRRIIAVLLFLTLALSIAPELRLSANAGSFLPSAGVKGSDFTNNTTLANKLDSIFGGNASVYSDNPCKTLVNTALGTSNVHNNTKELYVGPKNGSALNSGWSCWIYANGVYYTLFGEALGNGSPGKNSEKVNIFSTSNQKLTYENLCVWGVHSGVGAQVRIQTSSSSAHSIIILGYDSTHLTFLDGNGDGKGLVAVRKWSWSEVKNEYNTRGNVQYIVQPKQSYIDSTYPESDISYLSKCSELHPSYGKATVKNACNPHPLPCSNTVAQKYGASSPAMTDKALSPGQSIEINGIILNTEGHYWYKATLSDGTTAYVFSDECMEMELLDPYFSGDILPDQISGATYLGGEIIARGAKISAVQAIVYKGNSPSGTRIIESDIIRPNVTDKYSLYKSQVDYSLPFQNLTDGHYTIAIAVEVTNYLLTASKELKAQATQYLVTTEPFTYGNPGGCSHSYSAAVTPPTCESSGYTTYTCSKCGDSYTGNTVSALGHDYCVLLVTAPTCTSQGFTTYVCSNCDIRYTDDYVDPIGHQYGDWYRPGNAYDTERRDCQRCGHYETRTTSCDHAYSSVTTPPTCADMGYTTYICANCGHRYDADYIPPTDHVLGYLKEMIAPTCTEGGMYYGYCAFCNTHFYTESVDSLGHNWGEWYTVNTSTEQRNCINCSHYETRSSTASHEHSYTSAETAPTCQEEGYTTYTCSICGDSYTDNYVSPAGHSWGKWFEADPPTCTDSGIKRSNCQNCKSAYITTKTSPLGHNYQSSITEPTCTSQGYTTETCVNCQDRYDHSVVPAKGHQMGNWYIVKGATNTTDGYEQKDCANCTHHETRILPATQSPGNSSQPTTPSSTSTVENSLLNNPTALIVVGCVLMSIVLVIGIAIGKKKK